MTDKIEGKIPAWSGETRRASVPAGRDPFVNTPLLGLGPGADGAERFWISTWNANVGCLAALVTEHGEARIHRFADKRHAGFYSAVPEDGDTLWLCGNLSFVLRFSLRTGRFDEYPTGAPPALMFQGLALDRETGKLFAAAAPPHGVTALSFDTRRRETVKIHADIPGDRYMRHGFPNGDGTYSFVMHVPGETLLRWDPRTETVEAVPLGDGHDRAWTYCLVADDRGRRYFPGRGWYDPRAREFTADGPRPEREMTWFRRIGEVAWGAEIEDGNLRVGRWEMSSGRVRHLCTVPDCQVHNVNVTAGGKIVVVNLYGFFYRHDGETGALELTRRLASDSVGHVDCLCRIDEERLLGTPFITQRFWEVNLRTGRGFDCGRAAPGAGEVLQTWRLDGRVYMAAYTGGQLVEYDPAEHPHYPENPRVVAAPPRAMRPVASADDGRHIFYACSAPYGQLGSTVTRYDTRTGAARYAVNPLADQMIVSLRYDRATGSLLCGTTMNADMGSRSPASPVCWFARLDAGTLRVLDKAPAPDGVTRASVEGPLGDGRYLCLCHSRFGAHESAWFALDVADLRVPARGAMTPPPPETTLLLYAGRPGWFLLRRGPRLEAWDLRAASPVPGLVLADDFHGYGVKVQDDSVYLLREREVEVLEGCLRGLT